MRSDLVAERQDGQPAPLHQSHSEGKIQLTIKTNCADIIGAHGSLKS
jgi:hypothetical protein